MTLSCGEEEEEEGGGGGEGSRSGGVTSITELPKCVMESIVSLLPLKDAVDAVLVCPQWRHLSHPILTRRNLELNYRTVLGSTGTRKDQDLVFVRRVNRYLKQHQGNEVDSLVVNCSATTETRVNLVEWLRWAFNKGVKELKLRFWFPLFETYYVFPHHLLLVDSHSKLRDLFGERFVRRAPTTNLYGYNKLTSLSLYEVKVNKTLTENLFSACLVLESLVLHECKMTGGGSVMRIVANDRLTDLKVLQCKVSEHETPYYGEVNIIEVSAPNLASLEYTPDCTSRVHDDFLTIETPRLRKMFFKYFLLSRDALKPLMQLAACSRLETLHLQILAELRRISVPKFASLKQLKLDLELVLVWRRNENNVDVNCVMDLLKAAPLLEELQVMVYGPNLSANNLSEVTTQSPRSKFTNGHLKVVKMHGFRGNWYETELAICILETSPKLEMMVIDHMLTLYMGDGMFDGFQEKYTQEYKAVVEEKLKGVKTDAQIKFIS